MSKEPEEASEIDLQVLARGLPLSPLPPPHQRDDTKPHAPQHTPNLTPTEQRLALRNALRYFPAHLHPVLAEEFAEELASHGHIYMYRFRPDWRLLKARPLTDYPAACAQGAAMMLMIANNLDPKVAQFPEELVTYGGNGQVFSNWAQFWLVMQFLARITPNQTLAIYSGHPLGLFPSSPDAPRAVITNGMVVPSCSTPEDYEKLFALGVTQYGQMTAGSYCYIGPQGIVHGTTLTILNALRKHVATHAKCGRVFVTSGLGGMSGAQAKASVISDCIGVIAEISEEALTKRHKQGWLEEVATDLDDLISRLRKYRLESRVTSIGYRGNVVDLWERLVQEYKATGELLVDIGSDQTSCHNPFQGGYYPVDLSYEESRTLMLANPPLFKSRVEESLRRQVKAINYLSDHGLFFFDYGNAFLLQASRAGADVLASEGEGARNQFRYPSYVQDIMGDIFSMGFGPFRWVCTSGDPADLETTDRLAEHVIRDKLTNQTGLPDSVRQQYEDNLRWIEQAGQHRLVVGSQARILYSDQAGRVSLAVEFNRAIAMGKIKGHVVLSRDHHDVSGTDSPYRETSNIYDGSAFCADMAVHNVIGDAMRGATWVALHNGGGVGWGQAINGGFGFLLDGSQDAESRVTRMLAWDVSNGVARRSWSGHPLAMATIQRTMEVEQGLTVLVPNSVEDESLLDRVLANKNAAK